MMKRVFTRKYLIISVVIHLVIFVGMAIFINSNKIATTFLVFGAHSKKPTHSFVKFGRRGYVPFMGGGHKKGKGGKRGRGAKGKGAQDGKAAATKKQGRRTSTTQRRPTVVKKEAPQLEKAATMIEQAPGVQVVEKKALFKKNKGKDKGGKNGKNKKGDEKKKKEELAKKKSKELKKEEKLKAAPPPPPPPPVKPPEEEKTLEKQEEKVLENKKDETMDDHESTTADDHGMTPVDDELAATDGDDEAGDGEFDGEPLEFNLLAASDETLRVYQKSIQREVGRLWRPPLGVPRGTTCRMLFVVDRRGNIERYEFVTRSKILIYDLSILRVARQFKFDECLWGKRFTVDFCQ